MIQVTPEISIAENEIQFDYVRASGPGGQNVNKVSTAVQLRFNIDLSIIPEDVKHRLKRLAGKNLTESGELIIDSRRFRTQEQNRQDALQRLLSLIRQAAIKPKVRRKTKPTSASREVRLETKRKRSETKHLRRWSYGKDE